MKDVILVYKNAGETPYQALLRLRQKYPRLQGKKMGYAGRLDPMAEGLLLVLLGDENKNKKSYEDLSKVYEFCSLFGVSTDTFDILGKPTRVSHEVSSSGFEKKLKTKIKDYVGELIQEYPPYSSRHVRGKPLFWWARQNRLSEIKIPTRKSVIYRLILKDMQEVSCQEIKDFILERVGKVKGDFRQNEIIQSWHKFFEKRTGKMPVGSFEVESSSGTYVRGLVESLGKDLGTGATTLSIKRTKIGDFNLEEAVLL